MDSKFKKDMKKAQDRIFDELGAEFKDLLNKEMMSLEKISLFTGSIEKKLTALYDQKFPKKCNNCGRIYETMDQYAQETLRLRGKDTLFNASGVQMYRNCVCSSTLLVWTKEDRRDTSEFGNLRRQLFDTCLAKLKELSDEDENSLKEKLRIVFRQVIQASETSSEQSPTKDTHAKHFHNILTQISDKMIKSHHALKARNISNSQKSIRFTRVIEDELSTLFHQVFPKVCLVCDQHYETIEKYLEINKKDEHSIKENDHTWTCHCGAHLVVKSTSNRRDHSPFGDARRKLFELGLKKLKEFSKDSDISLQNHLRESFNRVIKQLEQNETEAKLETERKKP